MCEASLRTGGSLTGPAVSAEADAVWSSAEQYGEGPGAVRRGPHLLGQACREKALLCGDGLSRFCAELRFFIIAGNQ